MDSGVVHSRVNEYEDHHPHNVGSHQEEHNQDHEKKSVMEKVKAKAKKIKDTIKNHGHNDHEDHHDDHDLDEEAEEEDKDPEVHGAPIHESAAIKSATTAQEEPHQDPRVVAVSPNNESSQNRGTDSARTFVGEEGNTEQRKVNLERPMGSVEDPHSPGAIPQANIDPNYQTNVDDPTGAGAAEIDIRPVQKSFAGLNVHDDPKPKQEPKKVLATAVDTQYPSTGSHDQFLPELSTQTDTLSPSAAEKPHHEPMEKPSNQSSYSDKISSATSVITDKAISAKNVLASKLGYGDKGDKSETESQQEEHRTGEKPFNQGSYTEKISSAIANTAVSAKNVVTSKLGYGDNGDRDNDKVTSTHEGHKNKDASSTREKVGLSPTETLGPVYGKAAGVGSAVKSKVSGTGTGASSKSGVSMKDYMAEKLRPGDDDRALSELISETLHKRREEPTKGDHGNEGRTTVTEEISDAAHKREEPHKRREEPKKGDHGNEGRTTVTEVISDAVHKREEEPDKAEHQRLGKVTESEEVKRRLGTEKEQPHKGSEESYVNSSEKGVVGKLKDVVGSWIGSPGENQSSQVAAGGEDLSKNSGAGERRLQESSGKLKEY